MMSAVRAACGSFLMLAALGSHAAAPLQVPAWLYPSNSPQTPPAVDPQEQVQLPGSSQHYTQAQLVDLFSAPDWGWHPHGPMPAIVSQGRKPDVRACGFCHTPTGQGRPENASLAGLPRGYLEAQLRDFRDGRRRGAWPGTYAPVDLMIQAAEHLTDEEIASSAEYFAAQRPVPRTQIEERAVVPRAQVAGLVYVALPDEGTEPLRQRLLEFTPDAKRHEQRDDAMRYITYVPPGSVARGRTLATRGRAASAIQACSTCHGGDLRGIGAVPGIAGRAPTYVLRSLFAFRTGARSAPPAAPMQALCGRLSLADMIDAAAYAGSMTP